MKFNTSEFFKRLQLTKSHSKVCEEASLLNKKLVLLSRLIPTFKIKATFKQSKNSMTFDNKARSCTYTYVYYKKLNKTDRF